MRIALLIFALIYCGFKLPAQTGPAGVGTPANNVFWLKADKGTSSTTNNTPISSWNDQSGNSINMTQTVAAQQPSFATNIINGFPAVQFDNVNSANQNDKMLGPDSPILDNTSGYSFFTVTRPQNFGDAHVIVSKRTTVSVDQSFMMFYYTSNKMTVDVQTTNDRFASNMAFSANTNYLIDLLYDGTLANPRCSLYVSGLLDIAANETSTLVPDNASPIILGTTDASDPRPYGGYMSEIIIYRQALVPAQRIIVDNYLSAKYNIALSANDHYAGDDPLLGNYDYEVAGIGQESTGSNPSFSASVSGGLGIAAISGLDNTDYLLAGHASLTNSVITTDVAGLGGVNKARWQRVWNIDLTDVLVAITANVEFDLSDGGLPGTPFLASNYKLLYRPGQSGAWTEVATANAIVGDRILFNAYTFVADGYYTIGSTDYFTSPLPITLIDFTATAKGKQVQLSWTTASEKNNALFTVEKSKDGVAFVTVTTVPGKGSSDARHSYQTLDETPYEGLSYYRLKQTDTDGSSSYSPLVSFVAGEAEDLVRVFPNPSEGVIYLKLQGSRDEALTVSLYDESGRRCFLKTWAAGEYGATLMLDLQNTLAKGSYALSVSSGTRSYQQKLLLK